MRIQYLINVTYDETTVPSSESLQTEVIQNIINEVGNGMLNDNSNEVIIDTWHVKVEVKH